MKMNDNSNIKNNLFKNKFKTENCNNIIFIK